MEAREDKDVQETQALWLRIKEIVGAALECAASERRAFVDTACSNDEGLRREVDSLLAAYELTDETDNLSHRMAWLEDALENAPEAVPETIGPYRLIRELGVGGMGQVWLAEQTAPLRRLVALKLIKAGMYDPSVVQRFRSERQSLASMDHPAIARVFDAGATEAGQPYLVMEYVDGPPITDYCDAKKLDIQARLRLFLQVCEGVQHAHQKAIIHRDLKPSNILVIEVDGKPTPRLIDFGLAKATAAASSLEPDQAFATQVGILLGTPAYMSPEQADPLGRDRDIDTRADVYSLGVVLYELLTATLPFNARRSGDQPLDEYLRQFREAETQRPSQRVGSRSEMSAAQAEARGTEIRSLSESLRGDLDWITLKALEKNRDRRYDSPSALAADIANYLENRPIVARPASTGYRLKKYLRRNRVGVAVVSGALLLLIAFGISQTMQLRRITAERDRAQRERDRADRVTGFMTGMFNVSDPSEARGNSITAREVLDKSSQEIRTQLHQDPELQAQMMQVMGTVYIKLGLYSRAEPLLQQAEDTRARVLGPDNALTLESERSLEWAIFQQGRLAEAEKNDRALIATERRVLGANHRDTLAASSDLVWILDAEGRYPEAVQIGQATLAAQEREFGTEDADAIVLRGRLSGVLLSDNQTAEAEKLARESIELDRRLLGPENQVTLNTLHDLGLILIREERAAEAETLLSETLATQRRVMGSLHQNTIATMDSLATALQNQHKLAPAEAQYREAYQASLQTLGPDHHQTLMVLGNLASVIADEGKSAEAEKLDRQILESRRRTLGQDHPDTALAMFNLADALARQRRYEEAISLYRNSLDIQRRKLGPSASFTLDTMYCLAATLAINRQSEEALSQLRSAVDLGLPLKTHNYDLETDPDFKSVRNDARFAALVAEARNHQNSASISKP